ncbi:MAG: methyl-accepting chemotaxis protein [Pseudomonadales bacterium]|nr:methyl-accepting chemotaxis protein [Pseudomonadales bacterium]
MKINLPITENEVSLTDSTRLISTTNLKGITTYANQAFINISGFSEQELINKNHNVVRHPDMPVAAFKDLWDTLKQGRPWMGIVKNRSKNGDFYWVDAYITPMYEAGQIIGYQSVRTRPEPAHINRAEKLYRNINAGKISLTSRVTTSLFSKIFLTILAVTTLLSGSAFFTIGFQPALFIATFAALIAGFGISKLIVKNVTTSANHSRALFNSLIAQQVYTGKKDDVGQLEVTNTAVNARLRTVIGRVEDSANSLAESSHTTLTVAESTGENVAKQHQELDQIAAAMHEVSTSSSQVVENANRTAETATEAEQAVTEGKKIVDKTITEINSLSDGIDDALEVINDLHTRSEDIGAVIDVIRGVAEQTNLLALNAAIEAARAGEVGRGFAVVADEVRTLANRTQESTEQIQEIVEQLQKIAKKAVDVIHTTQSQTQTSVAQIARAGTALDDIDGAVSTISDMSTHIAAASSEQNIAVEEMSNSLVTVNLASDQISDDSKQNVDTSHELQTLVLQLQAMIKQFSP